jgi:hypothetical protein
MDAMHLPPGKPSEEGDSHYRRSNCLYPAVDEEDF